MLFTRNHEKEVEIEAMKEAYEYEILLVQEDSQNRIDNLERKRLELELELDKERKAGQDRLKSAVRNEANSKEEEWKAKLLAAEKSLLEEKSEFSFYFYAFLLTRLVTAEVLFLTFHLFSRDPVLFPYNEFQFQKRTSAVTSLVRRNA
jgi:hypothetical protein